MTIFTLSHSDYEEYQAYHFVAPEGATEEQFDKLCNELIKEAVDELIKRGGWRLTLENQESRNITWIGWSDIVEAIAQLLPKHGYQRVNFHKFNMWGGGCIGGIFAPIPYEEAYQPDNQNEHPLTREIYEQIQAHNMKVQKDLEERHK